MNNNLSQMYMQLRQNPSQILGNRFSVPQNLGNPNDIIQHLLNTGQVTQDQVNQVVQMRNHPMIQQLLQMKM